jgi:glycine/D-amino acid oxidase-like deaminating enzyme
LVGQTAARMRHTAHGYWLEEAAPAEPLAPLDGDTDADVVVIGGGYTGLWTAWWLAERAPGARIVVLEAERCGFGPSGRNGGFATALWDELDQLSHRFGDAAALEIARWSGESVRALGDWCDAEGVDAWYRRAGHLQVSASPAQDGALDDGIAAAARLGVGEQWVGLSAKEVAARIDLPRLRAGALMRDGATVQPARLALGLRERVRAREGVTVHEQSRVRRLDAAPGGVVAETASGRVRARGAVLAVNAAAAGIGPFRMRLTVGSSHIVLTEPVPDVLERIGWTGGECITDCRTFLHYFRTTPDGRIAFGWAGGRMGAGGRTGGRMDVDPEVVAQAARNLVALFPDLRGRRITHAWGGPIDVSPTHLLQLGTLPGAPVHYAFGFTGNGVAPSWLAGRVLSALALDRREPETRLALVDPEPVHVPPEPLRWLGGTAIRAAYLRREAREDEGRAADPLTRLVTEVPRLLGVHIGR